MNQQDFLKQAEERFNDLECLPEEDFGDLMFSFIFSLIQERDRQWVEVMKMKKIEGVEIDKSVPSDVLLEMLHDTEHVQKGYDAAVDEVNEKIKQMV